MRVATRSLYQGMQERIQQLAGDLKKINEQIATGKKILRPSDDPLSLVNAMQVKTAAAQLDQYSRNMESARPWLSMAESALSQTIDLIGQARELAVQMTSSTQDADTRAMAATEVDGLINQAISLANSQVGGRYIFAGYSTGTAPFTRVTVGGIDTAQYDGDTNTFQTLIAQGETLAVGKNGETVWMDSGLFDALGNLKAALENNDVTGIGQQLDSLVTAEDYLNNQLADVGARSQRVENRQSVVDALNLNFQERISNLEDSDLAGLLIDLNTREMSYQAALSTAARIHEMTLLDYMK
jgi:flagellar hook-associated protein 3 FlgL